MKLKSFLIPCLLTSFPLFFNNCQQSHTQVAGSEERNTPVEVISQEKATPTATYSIQEKNIQQVIKRSKGLSRLTLEVRYPYIFGKTRSAFVDSLNTDYKKRASESLQELQAMDLNMLDVLGERDFADDTTHYIFELANVSVNIWKNKVLNIIQEEYVMTHEEQFLGMTNFECLSYSLGSGRLLTEEDVFKPEFSQILKLRAKELLEVYEVNEYWISTDLENLHLDVRYLILREDGSFAYLYGVPIPHGRAVYEEIEFTTEEAKQLLKI